MELYVYGTGCGAGALLDEALDAGLVTAFVEEQEAGGSFLGRPVLRPEELTGRTVDLLIVTARPTDALRALCERLGPERVLYLKNHMELRDRNRSYERAAAVLPEAYLAALRRSERLIREPLWAGEERLTEEELAGDYVRLRTLELLCRRLAEVPGAAAELGVYRGGFARSINRLLPERTLYLFDSFSGFSPGESAGLGEGFLQAHRNTGAERVRAGLPYPERAVIRQGRFPETAAGLEEERFALVSLDVDLKESSYAGLSWFLPRMVRGGYLLLHDYNAPGLPGVRAALARWETENARRLPAVPLCDISGTLVIPL